MKSSICVTLISLTVLIISVRSDSLTSKRKQNDALTNEMRKSYQSFTANLVRDFIQTRKMGDPWGAQSLSPISVAYMLAVANTQIWPVPTQGLDKILFLPNKHIQNTYRQIVEQLTNDSHLFLHSKVLTSKKGFQTPQNVSDLKTRVSYIDYNAPNTNIAVLQINAMIAGLTFGKNYETLVPLGGWYGSAISSYTSGVFLNTLYFNGEWESPFYNIGLMEFAGSNKLPFLESYGNFAISLQSTYRALRIPLKNSSKVLILVEPRGGKTIKDFVSEDFESFMELRRNKSVDVWSSLELRIRVPSFNFSLVNSLSENLKHLGLKNSLCQFKLNNVHTFEAFAQSTYAHLAEDKFEITAVTGSTLTNIKSHGEFHQLGRVSSPEERPQSDKVEETTTTEKQNITSVSESTSAPSSSADSSAEDPDGMFVFDSPFLWYFEDEALGLGPLVLGTVETAPLLAEPEETPEGFQWLHELKRYMYWSCPDHAQRK